MSDTPSLPGVDPDSLLQTWYKAIRSWGCVHTDNYSIHAKDIIFHYTGEMDKAEFAGPNRNLASRCYVLAHSILSIDDPIFHQVVERMREEKENALLTYGTKLLADLAYRGVSARIPSPPPVHHPGPPT